MTENKSTWLEHAKTPEEVGVCSKEVQAFIDAVDADDEFQYEIVEVPGGILVAYKG